MAGKGSEYCTIGFLPCEGEGWGGRKDNPELIRGDNSAEALLEKIKAERAIIAIKKAKTRRKLKAVTKTKV